MRGKKSRIEQLEDRVERVKLPDQRALPDLDAAQTRLLDRCTHEAGLKVDDPELAHFFRPFSANPIKPAEQATALALLERLLKTTTGGARSYISALRITLLCRWEGRLTGVASADLKEYLGLLR